MAKPGDPENEHYDVRRRLPDGRVLTCPIEVMANLKPPTARDKIRLELAREAFRLLDKLEKQ